MVFSDLLFIFVFLPFFIVTYIFGTWIDNGRVRHAEKKEKELRRPMLWRNISLIIFSLLFYSWGEPVYIFLMLVAILINYVAGRLIDGSSSARAKKIWLFIGVALDLSILGTFKYLGLFTGTLAAAGLNVPVTYLPLPIGISFYVFQSISYLADVYRKDAPVQRNIFDLLLYIAMFPQLIAGPIVRYDTIAGEINSRATTLTDLSEGTYRFFIGLGKKVIFANILGEIATQLIGGSLENLSTWAAWVGIIAFIMQLYFDFSGYSDMAIGLGRAVGFHFRENFDHPFISQSLTEFWRRWHMSLGSFFRDYVYIPMGGNRRHQLLNIMTVWFLTGLWHGASWNFVIWGLYFGLILLIEKYTLLKWNIPRIFRHVLTIALIIIGFGFFYFEDFGRLGQFYHAFFGMGASRQGMPLEVESLIFDNLWLIVFALLFCIPIRPMISRKLDSMAEATPAVALPVMLTRAIISAGILIISVALLVGATNNAFLYYRF